MARRIALGALGAAPLRVSGLTRMTSIDFPGQLAAVVFCQGCPWRCGYCHNPELLDASAGGAIAWESVLAFLHGRRGLLDGVVFSGGEPLAQSALPQALAQVRAMGFATALHTGGMYPDRLAAVLLDLDSHALAMPVFGASRPRLLFCHVLFVWRGSVCGVACAGEMRRLYSCDA